MSTKNYTALWYERDEFDQWIETETFDTLHEAQRAAFINATKGDCHRYAEVHENTLISIRDGWETTAEWINHCDFGNKWSGWITRQKYEALYQ